MTSPVETWRRISPSYFEGCWNSINRPHRQPILDAVASLMPATSLLEIGCNAGPNLRLIHERWPEISLWGLDANEDAIHYMMAGQWNRRVGGLYGDLRVVLPKQEEKSVDIVLSSYCLAYIEPDEIADVLAHMQRIARVGLVVAEPAGPSRRIEAGIPEWEHDYLRHLRDPVNVVYCKQIEPPVERLNYVLAVSHR